MFRKCVEAWKEYGEIVRASFRWAKHHWKGYLAVCALFGAGSYLHYKANYRQRVIEDNLLAKTYVKKLEES